MAEKSEPGREAPKGNATGAARMARVQAASGAARSVEETLAGLGDPAPGDPAPGDPTSGDPAPGDPTSGDPAPGDPTSGASAPDAAGDVAGEVAEAEAAVVADLTSLGLSGPGVAPEIGAIERERDDYLDALRRLQADFENYKKRTLKQQTDQVARAAQSLVEKLLPVLDAVDLAVAHGAGQDVGQLAGLLLDTLVREGLEGVDPKPGEAFDPTVHEAVAHEPGDTGHQEVAELLRAGYRWKGNLLRPAMVKVRG